MHTRVVSCVLKQVKDLGHVLNFQFRLFFYHLNGHLVQLNVPLGKYGHVWPTSGSVVGIGYGPTPPDSLHYIISYNDLV